MPEEGFPVPGGERVQYDARDDGQADQSVCGEEGIFGRGAGKGAGTGGEAESGPGGVAECESDPWNANARGTVAGCGVGGVCGDALRRGVW